MYTYNNVGFIQVIDNLISSFANLFKFLSGVVHKDRIIDVCSLFDKIEENVSQKEIEELLVKKVLPKMPTYIWGADDFNIFISELSYFFQEKELDKFISREIKEKLKKSDAQKFLQRAFQLTYSKMLGITSEQIALIKSEKLNEIDLNYLKISREFIQSLEFIKNLSESSLKETNKLEFTDRRIKSLMKNYVIITLIFLRIYSISQRIHMKKMDLAIKETNYLCIERINVGG